MATVAQTWQYVSAPTADEAEQRLRMKLLQAQLDFWEQEAELRRRDLENVALRLLKGETVTIGYQDRQIAAVSLNTAQRMSGDIP